MTISERLENEYKRTQTLFRIINGEGHYIENGREYNRREFEEKYPVPLYTTKESNVIDADGTKRWLY